MERVLAGIEVRVVAALALDALAERDTDQVALQVIAPLMIHTRMGHPVAAQLSTHQRAPVGAAVDKGVQTAVLAARHHNRRIPDKAGLEIAGLGQLGLQADVIPHRTPENTLLLAFINGGVNEHLIRNVAVGLFGPGDLRCNINGLHGLPPHGRMPVPDRA